VEAAVSLDAYSSPPVDQDAEQVLDPYPKRETARHTKLAVSWETRAIARDLAPHLSGLTYVDNLTGASDELSLELEDKAGLWSGDWRPVYGDKVVARLEAQGWFGYGTPLTELRFGTFAHDKITLSGPPQRVSLQCVSAILATGLRRRKRTRAWRSVDLKQIANDIAQRAQMTLDFQGNAGPKYKSANQNNKSDLEFLEELCKEVGRTVKVSESTLVIYDEAALDAGAAVGEIDLRGGYVSDWSFDGDDSGRYGSCHVKCFDPRTGKTVAGQFPADGQVVEGLDPNGQTLELTIAVSDAGEALARAKALLRAANRFATTGKITTVGDPGLVAGVVFDLTNAFGFDGKFIITRAEHRPLGGYTCTLDVRRCVEGY
jgi:phage protein D